MSQRLNVSLFSCLCIVFPVSLFCVCGVFMCVVLFFLLFNTQLSKHRLSQRFHVFLKDSVCLLFVQFTISVKCPHHGRHREGNLCLQITKKHISDTLSSLPFSGFDFSLNFRVLRGSFEEKLTRKIHTVSLYMRFCKYLNQQRVRRVGEQNGNLSQVFLKNKK